MSKAAPKVILYVASSVDGYIARPDGAVDWLDAIAEPAGGTGEDYGYGEFIAGVGVVLMGRITYEQILSFGVDYPYPDAAGYVFSRTRAGEQDDNVRFVDGGDIAGLVARLKAEQDKNLWLVGGGQLVREFLRLDLIDRIELFILPIILGAGIPLFPPDTPTLSLTLTNCQSYDTGLVRLTYRKVDSIN
jgi:dihydrofolate reductase